MQGQESATASTRGSDDRGRFLYRTQALEPGFIRASRGFPHYIPERFRHEVLLHLLLNEIVYRDLLPVPDAPLILGVQGSPGVGKSWEAIGICATLDVLVYRLSGASLSGEYEGDAHEALLAAYLQAANADGPVALLIDDIDTSPASSFGEGVTYTVNRQLLCGMLMSITDVPTRPPNTPRSVRRVPIIATANDLRKLYQPLLRDGRITMFDYNLVPDEFAQKAITFLRPHIPNLEASSLSSCLPIRERKGTHQGTDHRPVTMASIVQACANCYKEAILSVLQDRKLLASGTLKDILQFLGNDPELVTTRVRSLDADSFVSTLHRISQANEPRGFLNDD